MSKKVKRTLDFGGVAKVTGLPVADAAGEAVPYDQLTDLLSQLKTSSERVGIGTGTASEIIGVFQIPITELYDGLRVSVRSPVGNGTTTTTLFKPDGVGNTALPIVKQGNVALGINDIPHAGYWMELRYDSSYSKWVLENPDNELWNNLIVKRRVFTASGTYIPSPGLISADVELVGGGGGGGGITGIANAAGAGGGGGAGEYRRKVFSASQIGASVAVVVGAGGVGSTGIGTAGGTSSFLTITAGGGGAGGAGNPSTSSTVSAAGGGSSAGTGGDISVPGTSGDAGLTLSASMALSGKGGDSVLGTGAYYVSGSANGYSGNGFGGGGSGGSAVNTTSAFSGGNGYQGVCIITEYCTDVIESNPLSETLVERAAIGGGNGNAITASFANTITSLSSSIIVRVRAPAGNGTNLVPTFKPDAMLALPIVRQGNIPLLENDIPYAGYWLNLIYDITYGKWVLQNPNRTVYQQTIVKRKMITVSGTYTPSAGLLYADVELIGGGGGGGGAAPTTTTASAGAGGGAGGYTRKIFSAAEIGASKTVTIGAAGTAAPGVSGGQGGTSTFDTLLTATGGNGGGYGVATTGIGINAGGQSGGTGSGGDINLRGSYSEGSVTFSASNALSGKGASSQFGAGGYYSAAYGVSPGGAGGAAIGYGAGGGGAAGQSTTNQYPGGVGGPGLCVITEYCTVNTDAATLGAERIAVGVGTAAAITATFVNQIINLSSPVSVLVRAPAANGTNLTPTFAPDGLTAAPIVREGNVALLENDIPYAGFWCRLVYDVTFAKWVLQNPAKTVTPEQFDDSVAPANTKHVQRSKGSMRDFISLSTSRSLTVDDIGCFIWGGAAGVTLTLPTPSSLGLKLGSSFELGASSNATTIAPGSGASINYMDSSAVASVVANAGLVYKVVAVTASIWHISCYQSGMLLSVKRYTANSTYTPTPGTKRIKVKVQGGGGGGGSNPATSATQAAASGGGAGGSYIEAWLFSVPSSVAVTVGAGGAGGVVGSPGGTGGTSSFGTYLVAPGGNGGAVGVATAGVYVVGGTAGGGTDPTYNSVNVVDKIKQGQAGTPAVVLNYGSIIGSRGGDSEYGTGGHQPATTGSRAGTGYGSGASGCFSGISLAAAAGIAGQAGIVIVEEYA